MKTRWLKALVALGSGLLMGLAPAPLNLWLLAWVALVPLWVWMAQPRRSGKPLTFLALLWGMGYHGLALSWITGLHPLTWMGIPWLASLGIVLFCWLFITLWGAVMVLLWGWSLRWLGRLLPVAPWWRILAGTALWCGLEYLWGLGPLYWTALAYTQSPHNLAILHLGQLSGPLTVSAAIVAVNGGIAEAWIHDQAHPRRLMPLNPSASNSQRHSLLNASSEILCRGLGGVVVLFVAVHLLGLWLYSRPLVQTPRDVLNIGIVQGNIPTRIKLSATGIQQAIAGYTSGYETLADQGVAAVLTPEGALPLLWEPQQLRGNPLYEAVLRQGVVLWLGTWLPQRNLTSADGSVPITQSLLTITGTGEIFSHFNKIKLVPLGEYTPFAELLGGLMHRLSVSQSDLLPGSLSQHFDTPFGRAAVAICYEVAFPDILRDQVAAGGQFILTASNVDPYSPIALSQHFAQATMRAIETDRWLVQATNTGYSGVIDPHGRIQWRSQHNVYAIHAATIQRRQTQTLYDHWGNWFTPLLLMVSLGSGGLLLVLKGSTR
ncbi:acyltransferase [Neosynechococcus sphagnicola sy1]|uniref:Apolipoprotein N-acyltransferase n=1 Tax=Neosynechococcus sphagnicola sy1 TaxID=1497020 RepID=A0A098TNX1_9CYAN|nr:apolipoprotein N-acyltransferase [Neosynechococcus sphagnicola]KGF73961.1 acyltransferase [Neosynechococcus sphagnicola sy1]